MNYSRIQAIFVKDYKEFSRNYAISIMVLFPLILAFLYNKTGSNNMQVYFLPINLTFSAVTTFIQTSLIAEEKEKNTLRSLMLSPASLFEILIGKSLLVFFISVVIILLSIFLVGYHPSNLIILGFALFISLIFYIGLGTLCGLFTKTILEASVAILPIMFIFSFAQFALDFSDKYPFLQVVEWLPSAQIFILAQSIEKDFTIMNVVTPLLSIFVWTFVIWLLAAVIYKKRMVD